jgi:hypothetical protein
VRRTLRRWLIRAVLILLVFVLLGIMAVWWFDVPRICGCEPDAAHATPDVGQAVAPAYYEVVEEDLQQVARIGSLGL